MIRWIKGHGLKLLFSTALCLTLVGVPQSPVAEGHGSNADHDHSGPPVGHPFEQTLSPFLSDETTGLLGGAASFQTDDAAGYRIIWGDGMPSHSTGAFPNAHNPNTIRKQTYQLRIPLHPQQASRLTWLEFGPFGIATNGVLFDPGTAEFWQNNRNWRYEALGGGVNLGLDRNNAHVQPTGAYHYHGLPSGLMKGNSPMLLGWAADGFPIYSPFGWGESGKGGLRSSWRIKSGTRSGGPGGTYDGRFVQDYEYVASLGDLDTCNGRSGVTREFPEGTYYYVVTQTFPFIPRCFTGTPDPSFQRRGGGPPGGRSGGANAGRRPDQGPNGHRPPPPPHHRPPRRW